MAINFVEHMTHFLKSKIFNIALISACLMISVGDAKASTQNVFDLSYAREVLHYFERPNNRAIAHIAFTPAAEKLNQWLKAKNLEPTSLQKTSFEVTKEQLLAKQEAGHINQIKALLTLISDNKNAQENCQTVTQNNLPTGLKISTPLYLIIAKDMDENEAGIMTMPAMALLNINDPQYDQNPNNIWKNCIHALHHASMKQLNPLPFNFASISKSDELLAYAEHLILLEGSAYFAMGERAQNGAKTLKRYDAFLKHFTGPPRQLTKGDFEYFENAFQTPKLAKEMGLFMAQEIEQKKGHKALLQSYTGGAASFFKAFQPSF